MNEDLTFTKVEIDNKEYQGRELLDIFNEKVRYAYYSDEASKDIFWFLWCSPLSPLFGKDKMATFERYFIDEKKRS